VVECKPFKLREDHIDSRERKKSLKTGPLNSMQYISIVQQTVLKSKNSENEEMTKQFKLHRISENLEE
jgi:hypothetical protein